MGRTHFISQLELRFDPSWEPFIIIIDWVPGVNVDLMIFFQKNGICHQWDSLLHPSSYLEFWAVFWCVYPIQIPFVEGLCGSNKIEREWRGCHFWAAIWWQWWRERHRQDTSTPLRTQQIWWGRFHSERQEGTLGFQADVWYLWWPSLMSLQ